MTDREFADVLRVKALSLLEASVSRLRIDRNNEAGTMAAHVAKYELLRLRELAQHLKALADVAETIR